MVATRGDRLVIRGRRHGAIDHDAEVLEVLGPDGRPPYRVRWRETGLESLAFPGPDAFVERRARGAYRAAAGPRGSRYEIWQILRTPKGKRILRFIHAVGTAAEASLLADSIAREAGAPRASIIVQDTARRQPLTRPRR